SLGAPPPYKGGRLLGGSVQRAPRPEGVRLGGGGPGPPGRPVTSRRRRPPPASLRLLMLKSLAFLGFLGANPRLSQRLGRCVRGGPRASAGQSDQPVPRPVGRAAGRPAPAGASPL